MKIHDEVAPVDEETWRRLTRYALDDQYSPMTALQQTDTQQVEERITVAKIREVRDRLAEAQAKWLGEAAAQGLHNHQLDAFRYSMGPGVSVSRRTAAEIVGMGNFELSCDGHPTLQKEWRTFLSGKNGGGHLVEVRRRGLKMKGRGYYVTLNGGVLYDGHGLTWEQAKAVYTRYLMKDEPDDP